MTTTVPFTPDSSTAICRASTQTIRRRRSRDLLATGGPSACATNIADSYFDTAHAILQATVDADVPDRERAVQALTQTRLRTPVIDETVP